MAVDNLATRAVVTAHERGFLRGTGKPLDPALGRCFLGLVALSIGIFGQSGIRTVMGTVTDSRGHLLSGAVVQVEDMTSLHIRSFVTAADGSFSFRDLSTDRDYRLRARYRRIWGGRKTLSEFDSRKVAIVNLKVDAQKEE